MANQHSEKNRNFEENLVRFFKTRVLLCRLITLFLMIVGGYAIAASIQNKNTMGMLMAILGMGAGIFFFLLLSKAKEIQEEGEDY